MGLLEVQQFVENHLARLLAGMFIGVDLSGRFRVVRDIDKWRAEIKEIWDIKKGNAPINYEVYFDDEFVSSFNDKMSLKQIEHDFLRGFLDLYREKKVFLNKELYKEREEKLKYEKIMTEEAKRKMREKDLSKLNKPDREVVLEILKATDKGDKNETAR